MNDLVLDVNQLYALAACAVMVASAYVEGPISGNETYRRTVIHYAADGLLHSTGIRMVDLESLGHQISRHALSIDQMSKRNTHD